AASRRSRRPNSILDRGSRRRNRIVLLRKQEPRIASRIAFGSGLLLSQEHEQGGDIMAPNSPWQHHRSASVADDIDFEIKGQELQFVEIELDPGESAVAEAGAMVWKDASVEMTTVFGDG